MTTGGGLVFGGDVNGRFHAFDQKSGQVLWETGNAGTASSFLRLTPELQPSVGNNLFVFALPERKK